MALRTEWGCVMGPAKLSLLQARTPDRIVKRHSHREAARGLRLPVIIMTGVWAISVSSTRTVGLSPATTVRASTHTRFPDGVHAGRFVLAARLDYAVAANLNVALSLFRADRTSHGYSWACIGPNAGVGAFPGTPDGNIDLNLNRYPGSPNIPDGSLGTEIGLSMDWKLLEGLVLGINAAYWKPGAWFTYACVDRSVPGWATGTAANLYGTKPMKEIDPVVGGQFLLTVDF